jgi:ABC-2 type transport system permease protein
VSGARVWRVLAKDLRLGPRSPFLLWALALPVILTLFLRGVFGGLFTGEPRLGITDEGASVLVAAAMAVDGLAVSEVDEAQALRALVEGADLDAGIVLPAGFDDAVRAGDQPPMQLWIGGESLASNRAVVIATVLDLVRDVEGSDPPVTVEVVTLGEEGMPLDLRMLPLMVMFAVAIAGAMVPAASIVEEKERRTIDALLVSPTSIGEVLAAKGVLGWMFGMAAAGVTLAINQAFGARPALLVLAVAIGALMMVEVGLILGAWAPDTNTLFAAWKGGAMVLVYPVVFFLWPDLPGWIARLGPTYYFLRPVFALSVEGAGAGDVIGDLAVALVVCAALLPLVVLSGRRLEMRLAGGTSGRAAAPEPEMAG